MYWIPLESNPEVLNEWAKKAGLLTSQAQFTDIYGLDPDLLSMVPQPAKAVVLLFPIPDALGAERKEEDKRREKEGQHPTDPTIVYIVQTIRNACGAIGLLHAVINSGVDIGPETPLHQYIDKCQSLNPQERGELLEKSDIFAAIHLGAANHGQTAAPAADAEVDFHFTCFVPAPDPSQEGAQRLIELDGVRGGPIDCGPCTDLLSDVAKYVKSKYISASENVNFSMVALAPPQAY